MARMRDYDDNREPRSPSPSTSGMAIFSLVSGIIGLLLCWFIGPLIALICGFLALSGISGSQGRLQGRGLAITGIILGGLGMVVSLVGSYVTYEGWKRVEAMVKLKEAQDNLKQLGMAVHQYHELHDSLPLYAIMSKDGKPLLSWRVALLPYMEQDALYKKFNLDEPWDSPHNIKLLAEMPKVYANPRFPQTPPDQTFFRVFVGPETVFRPAPRAGQASRGVTLAQITAQDGSVGTVLVVEAGEAVPWTKPDELTFTKDGPLPALGGPTGDFFVYLTCDSAVHRGRKTADPAKIRSLIHMTDNVAVSEKELE
jgi:hypothetical protein